MGKFYQTGHQKIMIKVDIAGQKEVWANCSKAVYDFAKTAFKQGDVVHVQYQFNSESSNLKYYVVRIEKGEGQDVQVTKENTPAPATNTQQNTSAPTPPGPGVQQDPPKSSYTGGYKGKTNTEREEIRAQAIGHMVSRSLMCLQGHVDPNNILGVIDTLHKKYEELIRKVQ